MAAKTYLVVYQDETDGPVHCRRMYKRQITDLINRKVNPLAVEDLLIIDGHTIKGFGLYRNLDKLLE